MPETPSIATTVHSVVARAFAVREGSLAPETSLYDDLGADSLRVMELMNELEDELGIDLLESTEFALSVRTVGDLVEAFEAHGA